MAKRQYGALLYFKKGVPEERIRAWIRALESKGVLDETLASDKITPGAYLGGFDKDHGVPVWYIP